MVFFLGLVIAVELIALGVGSGFLIWAYRHDGAGRGFAKVIGYIITIAVSLMLICTVLHTFKYASKGYFKGGYHHGYMMKKSGCCAKGSCCAKGGCCMKKLGPSHPGPRR